MRDVEKLQRRARKGPGILATAEAAWSDEDRQQIAINRAKVQLEERRHGPR
jgi:hypothetical protein